MRRNGRIFAPPLINVDADNHYLLSFSSPPCLLPTSMLDILRQNRSEPLLKINIDEGGGGEIVKKRFKTFDPSLKMNIDEGGGGGGSEIVKKTLRALPQNEH